ncbi:muconolactone Delta-isomerase family protein [Nocardia sp. NPDC101769]|uniref:muconolactone Delta-isomerase family protein n=1 Tax=Nocardia sp. NPDC101769 TaxID=3364333 RepID=UPI00382D790F
MRREVMQEFLVQIITTIPDGTPDEEVARRRAAEQVRARELAAAGNLYRLWRPVGELRSIGIWCAATLEELQHKVLDTLPLRPWMTIDVAPLQAHPNDPGRLQ